MPDPNLLPLAAWGSFYVIIGSAAAALTGLMFVVVTLIPESRTATTGESLSAFGTPTVVHFCAALLVSAILCAPWTDVQRAGLATAAVGAFGLIYVILVIGRARRQAEYRPVFSDWLWHVVLPLAAYGALVASSLTVAIGTTDLLFVVGAATVVLLFIGIHNAWDTVTFIAIDRVRAKGTDTPRDTAERRDSSTHERQAD